MDKDQADSFEKEYGYRPKVAREQRHIIQWFYQRVFKDSDVSSPSNRGGFETNSLIDGRSTIKLDF